MLMELGGISAKTLGSLSMLAGVGTVAADVMPVPDGWSNWPATAILGFITLATLGVLVMKLKQDAAVQKAAAQAQTDLAVALTKSHEMQESTNRTLNGVSQALMQRPCLLERK